MMSKSSTYIRGFSRQNGDHMVLLFSTTNTSMPWALGAMIPPSGLLKLLGRVAVLRNMRRNSQKCFDEGGPIGFGFVEPVRTVTRGKKNPVESTAVDRVQQC
jgi:hypothetical protein